MPAKMGKVPCEDLGRVVGCGGKENNNNDDERGGYYDLTMLKAHWRKVQDLGLRKLYEENKEIRNHVRKCAVLAHLPEEKVTDGRLSTIENSSTNKATVKFNDYFGGECIDNSHRIWTCDRELYWNTISVEGWHNRLNKRIGKAHPNIYELMSN
ncbi:hypothetical protein Trydic_g5795 [Trypoxylus dichotomus]